MQQSHSVRNEPIVEVNQHLLVKLMFACASDVEYRQKSELVSNNTNPTSNWHCCSSYGDPLEKLGALHPTFQGHSRSQNSEIIRAGND